MQSNSLQKTQSQVVVSNDQQQVQRTQPQFQIRKTAPRQLNFTQTQASTTQLRSPRNKYNSTNMKQIKVGQVTRALSARKPNNVPDIRINFDRVDRSTSPAIVNNWIKAEKEGMLNLSSRNDNDKPRKSSLLMVNTDILSTNFSSRKSSNLSNFNLSRRSSRHSSGRSEISRNSAAGRGPSITIFKEIGKPAQNIRPDPIKVAQRELEAQQDEYRRDVLLECDRSNIRTSASLNRAIQTDKELTKSIQASQMLNKLYQSHIDGFNQMCEEKLNSPEVKDQSCKLLPESQNKRRQSFGRSQSRTVRRQRPLMHKQMTSTAYPKVGNFLAGSNLSNGGSPFKAGNYISNDRYAYINQRFQICAISMSH